MRGLIWRDNTCNTWRMSLIPRLGVWFSFSPLFFRGNDGKLRFENFTLFCVDLSHQDYRNVWELRLVVFNFLLSIEWYYGKDKTVLFDRYECSDP